MSVGVGSGVAVQEAAGSGGANGSGSRGGTAQASGAAAAGPARPSAAPSASAAPPSSRRRRPVDRPVTRWVPMSARPVIDVADAESAVLMLLDHQRELAV